MASKWEYNGQVSTSVKMADGETISLAALMDDAQIDGILEKYPDLRTYYRLKNGTDGSSGAGDKHYVHTQGTPATIWVVNHNLGKSPAVTVLDTANTRWSAEESHNGLNQVVLRFSAAFSGTAVCN